MTIIINHIGCCNYCLDFIICTDLCKISMLYCLAFQQSKTHFNADLPQITFSDDLKHLQHNLTADLMI